MKFKVGQKVKLVNKSSMAAPLGAIAVVVGVNDWKIGHIKVVWKGNVNCQMDGHYHSTCFKIISTKNRQLLFPFMEELHAAL